MKNLNRLLVKIAKEINALPKKKELPETEGN